MSYRYSDCEAMFGENMERRCVGCGEPLKGRQTVWCAGECQRLWQQNHLWGDARKAAKDRQPTCERCGVPHNWRSRGECLEVNHRTPIMGRHAQVGCHHHQEGLQVLCHGCHVDETNRQFRKGRHRPTTGHPPDAGHIRQDQRAAITKAAQAAIDRPTSDDAAVPTVESTAPRNTAMELTSE